MKKTRYESVFHYIFIVLLLAAFLYLVFGEILLPKDQWGDTSQFDTYQGAWSRVLPSGKKEPIELPGKYAAKRNEKFVLETVLPQNIQNDMYLCFRSAKQELSFYVDGKLRQDYSTKRTRLFGKDSAVAYVFVKVEPSDSGKVLQMHARTDSAYTGIFYTVYMGTQKDIWYHYGEHYGVEVLVAFLLFVLGLLAAIVSEVLHVFYKQKIALAYLGLGVLIASVWLLANSVFRQIFFPNLSVINDVAFCTIMLIPFPFLMYMNEVQKGRYRKVYLLLECLSVIDFVICTFLHVLKIKDYTDTIVYMTVVCVLTIVAMVYGIVMDLLKGYIKEYMIVSFGLLAAFFFAVVQIFVYYNRTSVFNGVFLAIGLLFLLFFAVIGTVRDLVVLEREKVQAVLASESKGRFLANMSHEIRTPINAVLGMDAVILRETTEPEIREYAMDIQNAGQTLLSLINDILDLSKIESGKMEILLENYELGSLLHDVMNMILMRVKNKHLKVNLRVDKNLPSGLYGDDIRIRQVLVNLMTNAVKYTERGSITLEIKGVVSGDKVRLAFAVIDTGIGIRKEDIKKLFRAFERIDEADRRYIEGTGLGMSITNSLLTMMGSKLQVESEYGKGSTFFFELEQEIWNREPIGDISERMKSRAENYEYSVSFQAPEAELLIVDDNAMNRKVFRKLLTDTKVKLDEADSGFECLEMIQKKHYDLIFLDHMMPEMDGIETLHKMQERKHLCNDTPVVVLTANAVAGAREMYLTEGFKEYISKPTDPEKLEKVIVEFLPPEKVRKGTFVPEKKRKTEKEKEFTFPDIPGIRWDVALEKMKSAELLLESAEDFCELNEAEALTIERFAGQILSGDTEALDGFRIKVHSMKSSSALIGATSVSDVARALEYAAGQGDVETIRKVTPAFLESWRDLKKSLSVLFPEEQKKKKEPDYLMLLEYLRLLKDAIADMDIDTSDEIIRLLKGIQYTPEEEKLVAELSLAVAEINADKTITLANQMEEIASEHLL